MPALARTFHLASGLSSVTPAEIVKVPVGVDGEHEVPDREREEVDEHPEDVDGAVGCDDDEDTGETEDEDEEDERDCGSRCVGNCCFEGKSDWENELI